MTDKTITIIIDAERYHNILGEIYSIENELICEEGCSMTEEEYAARADIRSNLYYRLDMLHRRFVDYITDCEIDSNDNHVAQNQSCPF